MENTIEIIKKRGRPIKENKDAKAYYQNFKSKHPNIINNKHECEICGGSYTYYTKSSHIKSKKHMKIKEIYKTDKCINPLSVRIVDEKKAKIKELKKQIADLNKNIDIEVIGNLNN
jgi:hypothetical protein